MRTLGIDPGERRIGLAVSDALGITAQGLETFDRKKDGDFLEYIEQLVKSREITAIVVGLPLRASGEGGRESERSRRLARQLRERLALEVTLWDERYSSQEAERVIRESGMPAKKRRQKGNVDRIAAVLILQSYLDSKQGRA